MPHALTELKLTAVTKPVHAPDHDIHTDVCVVGAGIAGLSAAIESARLGRDVVLVDSLPLIGGQMVHSLVGLFCGVFGNAPRYTQLTHGVFDDIFRDLGPTGDLHFQRGHTTTVYYNEVALGRWLERRILALGVRTILGTVLQQVDIRDGRIERISLASRYGNVSVTATGFVDASGDAALTWEAGLPCWVPGGRSTAHSRSSSRTWTRTTSPTPLRWTPVSPPEAATTGCCGAAGSPSTSPGAGSPC